MSLCSSHENVQDGPRQECSWPKIVYWTVTKWITINKNETELRSSFLWQEIKKEEKTPHTYWNLGVKQTPNKSKVNFSLPTWVLLLQKNNEMNVQLHEILDVKFKIGVFCISTKEFHSTPEWSMAKVYLFGDKLTVRVVPLLPSLHVLVTGTQIQQKWATYTFWLHL